jgi:hypothetical protein
MTEGTQGREIRKPLKLDIRVTMLLTCVQESHPRLSIIKFGKRSMFKHWSAQNSSKERSFYAFTNGFRIHVMLGTEISVV